MAKGMLQRKDISGKEYERWTVIRRNEIGKTSLWLCRCKCGTERLVYQGDLKSGSSKSCGCLTSEVTAARNRTHGKTYSVEYECWSGIKKRCYNENSEAFQWYGARGVKVCDRWLSSFENFLADMGQKPSALHSIERRNTDGDYCPENCYWGTALEQGKNKRNNRLLTARGETFHLSEWSRITGLGITTILRRLARGWSEEDAILLPKKVNQFG